MGPNWDEKSDLLLISNYADYQEFDDPETELCILFNKMGISSFNERDIKRRIKLLKLAKGKEKAMEVFNHMYKDEMQVSEIEKQTILKRCYQKVIYLKKKILNPKIALT